jgi:hypothetical protein
MVHDERGPATAMELVTHRLKTYIEAGDPQAIADMIDAARREGALAERHKRTEWPDIGDPNGQVW